MSLQKNKKLLNEEGDYEEAENLSGSEKNVSLSQHDVTENEQDEEELVKLRAKLYRYDIPQHEWKERGIGCIKLLRHWENDYVRIVMRRDRTLKVCANHLVTPEIKMNVHRGSDKAFIWSVFADFADEMRKQELFAVKFVSAENAQLWKTKFEEAQDIIKSKSCDNESSIESNEPQCSEKPPDEHNKNLSEIESDTVVKNLKELKVDTD